MAAGRFDKRATFSRRPVVNEVVQDYAPTFTLWAGYRPLTVREAAQGGTAQNVESGILTVRTDARALTITNADRVAVDGRDFAVDGVGLPDRRTGTIQLNVSSNLGGE